MCRQKEQLQQQVSSAQALLQELRAAHATSEAALRKARRKAAHDTETAIAEYDKDVAERHSAVVAEDSLLQELTSRLSVRCCLHVHLYVWGALCIMVQSCANIKHPQSRVVA